jgi:UPF0042 nucleotide-binding protein
LRIVVLTGMSGAGRTAALRDFEDLGWYGVDNLPPALLTDLAARLADSGVADRLAVVMDTRSGRLFSDLPEAVAGARSAGHHVEIIFLEAADEVLVRRFKETRRHHPLDEDAGSVQRGIEMERLELAPVRASADRVLDTSRLSARGLAAELRGGYDVDATTGGLRVTVLSFGFKHGLPEDADLVFDLRFLRNPYWDPGLRHGTGLEPAVVEYINEDPRTGEMKGRLQGLLEFLLPCYVDEGKAYLTVAVGCTGGRHRSVHFAEHLTAWLASQGYRAAVRHRDLNPAE